MSEKCRKELFGVLVIRTKAQIPEINIVKQRLFYKLDVSTLRQHTKRRFIKKKRWFKMFITAISDF